MENLNAEQVTNPNSELYDYVKKIVAAVKYKGEGDHEDVPSILRKFAKGYEQRIKELTEENERLRVDCVKGANALIEEIQKNRTIEADTVRKMQERLKERFSTATRYSKYSGAGVVMVIDQIAKEMLEGENEN